jgi:hypothetical protein
MKKENELPPFLAACCIALCLGIGLSSADYLLGTSESQNKRPEQTSDNQRATGETKQPSAAIVSIASGEHDVSAAASSQNGNQAGGGTNIWMILQGLSAPLVALFTLILTGASILQWCVYRHIRNDTRSKNRAFVFVREIQYEAVTPAKDREAIVEWLFTFGKTAGTPLLAVK